MNHQFLRPEESHAVKSHTELTIDRLIVFIAYVINYTIRVTEKIEKNEIIVKRIEKFEGLKMYPGSVTLKES